jgi:hypothetical protein
VLRPKPSRLVSVVLLLSALMVLGCLESAETGAREAITLDFESAAVGELPADFSTAITGGGGPAAWRVVEDASAPGGGKVLAQTSTDQTSSRFPLCIYEGLTATDVELSVRFKPVSGTVDQAAGLVARYRDKDNYYIVRANALENNVRLYKVERGKRTQFAGMDVKVPANVWQTLTWEVKGTHFRVRLNDTLLFEADDRTFSGAGKVGLWTKADSVTHFDDLTIRPSETQ